MLQIYIASYRHVLDWAQQIGASAAPTGWEFPFPKVLGDDVSTLRIQPAVLLHTPGGTQQLCCGSAQTWTRQWNM